ncbi:hypothetical protein HNR46_001230 [Haloferula luteola]|uniref:Uncharacterized protein n=1 Tax=Haloferula luteola TaxID=595692 RepID=A0A840V1R4_9BACT|nr:hypothetical protein [Haloferula luteola]MBB5350996.1 hypothetical protein [Haloferula luteola]
MSSASRPTFTFASIIALVVSIASFYQGPILGLLLAITAMIFGLFGVLMSLSSRKRGGIVSFTAISLGGLGILAAIIRAIAYLIE